MVNVNNEYSKLKEVIVGTINNANMPAHGTDLHAINYADKDKISSLCLSILAASNTGSISVKVSLLKSFL